MAEKSSFETHRYLAFVDLSTLHAASEANPRQLRPPHPKHEQYTVCRHQMKSSHREHRSLARTKQPDHSIRRRFPHVTTGTFRACLHSLTEASPKRGKSRTPVEGSKSPTEARPGPGFSWTSPASRRIAIR
ncbi:hypothetical protein Q7C36_011995 [Tachysurus vachellii]|uniref:Uncharacterized protein n=1 Tax=Tachysurus vachellii TaxID=175792 RepID=A0AA88SLX3_TACVA|nr:hypothetical protein Q7C36_011995 [Tachysurus vachellii]